MLASGQICAQTNSPGQVDPSFAPAVSGQLDGAVLAAAAQPDGKLIIVGNFTRVGSANHHGIARLQPDGTLDTGFKGGPGADTIVNCVSLQTDGKILIGGPFTNVDGFARSALARLSHDGSVDTNFNSLLALSGTINAIALDTNGAILIAGAFTALGHTNLARLIADGSVDPTFNAQLTDGQIVNAVWRQPDNQILVAGNFIAIDSVNRSRIARLNPDGSLDPTFDPSSGTDGPIYTLDVKSNGSVVLGGRFHNLCGATRNFIGELNPDGSLSSNFAYSGADDAIYSLFVDSMQRTIIGGRFSVVNGATNNHLARLLGDGSLDPQFTAGTGANASLYSVATCIGSNILTGGLLTTMNGQAEKFIAQLSDNGAVNPQFNPARGINNIVYSIAALSSGNVVVGGAFQNIDGHGQTSIASLRNDGALDPSLAPQLGPGSFVRTLALQPNQKLVPGGVMSTNGATNVFKVLRLNSDGSIDPALRPGADPTARIQAVLVQSDNKILIAGNFSHYNGATCNGIGRLNQDGSLDPAFSSGTGPNDNINAAALQTDGKIVIGGDFTLYAGLSRARIARLRTDGSLDSSFNSAASANSSVDAIAIDAQQRILLAGAFTSVNGTGRMGVARLLPTGALDPSFSFQNGADSIVSAILPQPDGKILIGGFFTKIAGVSRNHIARLNSNGSLDITFDVGAGTDSTVYALALQPDNKVLIGGGFQQANGIVRSFVARLFNDPLPLRLIINIDAFVPNVILNVTGSPNSTIAIETSTDIQHWQPQSTGLIPAGGSLSITDSSPALPPNQFYRARYQ